MNNLVNYVEKINEVIKDLNFDDRMTVFYRMVTVTFFCGYNKPDKEVFMENISNSFDHYEEYANLLRINNKD